MKLIHTSSLAAVYWCWIGNSIIILGHGAASALSPSSPIALTSTTAALWSRKSFSATASVNTSQTSSALHSSQSDTEFEMTTITEIAAPVNSTSTTTSSQLKMTTKAAALMNLIVTKSKQILSSSELQSTAAVSVGTLTTYYLNNFTPLGPIQASSVVGIATCLVMPLPLALAAFCGSFAGMAKSAVIPAGGFSVLVLGVVCAGMKGMFEQQKWFLGVGGRLGFIAQCACTLQFVVSSLLLKQPIVSSTATATLVGSFGDPIQVLTRLPAVCASTVAGALFMSFWKEAMAEKVLQKKIDDEKQVKIYERLSNSVAAAGVTGLLAATLFPTSVAGPAFCGSFIAMSAPSKLETYGSLIGASLMGGVCQQAMSGVLLGGWGGRLGTASLLGVLSYRFLVSSMKKSPHPSTKAA